MPGDLPIVIIGAGPAGLVAALETARRGVPVRLVERALAPATSSRAKGVQPRSLELLERQGLIDAVLEAGGPFPPWRSYAGGRVVGERPIYDLLGVTIADSPSVPYPQTWMVAQFRLEAVLRAGLRDAGVIIEWGTELTGLQVRDTRVQLELRTPAGPECLDAGYVLGADGAASTVRRALGISFDGVTRDDERYLIADVRTPDLDPHVWHNWSDPTDEHARLSMCPLPGTDLVQLVAPVAPGAPEPDLTLDAVQRIVDLRAQDAVIRLTALSWAGISRANERLAATYRRGPVFLLGDAAHTVPAAGGQGMNVAMQDAANVAWKLVAVHTGAPADLLDTYERERRPLARNLMSGLSTANGRTEGPDVFQLTDHYRGGPLALDTRAHPGTVRAGDRAPDVLLIASGGHPIRLFQRAAAADHLIVALGADALTAARTVPLRPGARTAVLDLHHEHRASASRFRSVYDLRPDTSMLLVIRPDGHLGLVADHDFATHLAEYARRTGMSA